MGRFSVPDEFHNDSHPDDPQSWNQYVYVRNRPTDLIDPTGEKAEYQVTIDHEKKTVTVTVIATIGIYSTNSATKKDLASVAKNIKSQIESKWKTSFKETDSNGTTWKVDFKANVSVEVNATANSADEVLQKNNKLMNVIQIETLPPGVSSYVRNQLASGPGASIKNPDGTYPDVGLWHYSAAKTSGEPAHEFGHVLGPVNQGNAGSDLIAPGTPQARQMSVFDFDKTVGYRARLYRDYVTTSVATDPNARKRVKFLRFRRVCCN